MSIIVTEKRIFIYTRLLILEILFNFTLLMIYYLVIYYGFCCYMPFIPICILFFLQKQFLFIAKQLNQQIVYLNKCLKRKLYSGKIDLDRIRIRDVRLRRPKPYPLGQGGVWQDRNLNVYILKFLRTTEYNFQQKYLILTKYEQSKQHKYSY